MTGICFGFGSLHDTSLKLLLRCSELIQLFAYLIYCVWRCIGGLMTVAIVVGHAPHWHVRAHPGVVHAVKQVQCWPWWAHPVVALSPNLET